MGLWIHICCTSSICVNDSSSEGPVWGDAWETFLFRSADPGRVFILFYFFRGNSSCLAALIPAVWLYLHTYSNKEACFNNRKRSRPPVTELKQVDATTVLSRCKTSFPDTKQNILQLRPTFIIIFEVLSQLTNKGPPKKKKKKTRNRKQSKVLCLNSIENMHGYHGNCTCSLQLK